MQHFRLQCECGYVSNPVPYGSGPWSATFAVPIAVANDLQLHSIEVQKLESETEEAFDGRLERAIDEEATKEFSQGFTRMTPAALRDDQFVICPNCHEMLAKFELAGF